MMRSPRKGELESGSLSTRECSRKLCRWSDRPLPLPQGEGRGVTVLGRYEVCLTYRILLGDKSLAVIAFDGR
jgi:hypothetical protein